MRKNLLRNVPTPTIATMAYASAKYAMLDWINGNPADAESMLRAAWHYLQAIKSRNDPDAARLIIAIQRNINDVELLFHKGR